MSASATYPTPQHAPGPQAADTHAADTEFYRQALHDLINVGTHLARHLPEQADAQAAQQASTPTPQPTAAHPAPAPPAPDALVKIVASFDPLARAVRRCIAQAQNLNAPKQQPPARNPSQDRTTARRRIIRAVEDVIQRPPDNDECDDAEVLLADLRERMDAPDLEDDIANRPAEDIIKEILRDLGLAALPGSRPWKRRTQADIAALNASAAAPSSPASSAGHSPCASLQDGHPAAQPSPGPDYPKPSQPAAPARAPVHPSHSLPEDPAEAVAFVLRQAARANVRWRPPPEG
ncbi:MAG TPA: hypothetical protein VGC15_10205 [Acetobacteraceae bacterium]